jgi:peptidoglycan/LPS O-acetylase OafA/YrhL
MSSFVITPRSRPSTVPLPQTRAQRVPAIDMTRYLAALAVIWIHVTHDVATQASIQPARLAVPFFCALSGYLAIGSLLKNPSQRFAEFFRSRLVRLYLPFAAWSCIYLIFKIVKKRLLPDQPSDLPGWEFFIVGGAYHLWFFPFIAAGSLLAYVTACARKWERVAGILPTLLCATGAAIAFAPNPCASDQAWSYMWDAIPSLLWGIGIGYWTFHPSEKVVEARARLNSLKTWAFLFATCAVWLAIGSTYWLGRSNFLEGVGGVSILLGCLCFPAHQSAREFWNGERLTAIATQLGSLSMGVYCVHLLVLKVIESIANKCQLPSGMATEIAIWIATAMISTFVAWSLSRSNRTRWLAT